MTKRINDYLYGITGKRVDERDSVLRDQVLAGIDTEQREDVWWVADDRGHLGDSPGLPSFESDVVKEEPIPLPASSPHRLPLLPRAPDDVSMKPEVELPRPPLEQFSPKLKRSMERI